MTTQATTAERAKIETRIAELEARPRALVGSDSGTHGKPDRCDIYEEITGERYAVVGFAGSNGSRCPEAEAVADTSGRVRYFPLATAEIRSQRKELADLREQLRKMDRR